MTDSAQDKPVCNPVPPTQIERIEAAILTLMKDGLSAGFYIDVFPDEPDTFDDSKIGRAALLQYRGSAYSPRDGLGAGALNRTTTFIVHLIYNAMVEAGSRPVRDIERLRMALQGRDIEAGSVELVRDGLAEQSGTRRRYLLEMRITVPTVAVPQTALAPITETFTGET